MSRKAQILTTLALVLLLAWGVGMFHFIHPLARTSSLEVIYGEGEDFFTQAVVYHKIFDRNVYYLHLPHARPENRWWLVDFNRPMIFQTGKVRSLPFKRKFVLRDDPPGVKVDDRAALGDWRWHFTPEGAAFSGNGFSCRVRRKG